MHAKNEVDPFLWVCKLIYKERGKEGLEGGGGLNPDLNVQLAVKHL